MEILVVIALIGFLAVLAGPVAGKWIRRSEDMAALSSARQVLAVARLEAIRRSANVVVEVSAVSSSDNRIRLRTFEDRANDPIPSCAGGSNVRNPCARDSDCPGSTCNLTLPADEALAAGNCVWDHGTFTTSPATDELILGDVSLSPRIHFWKQGGSKDSLTDGICFDTYKTVASPSGDTSLTDRIVFLPSGGISRPQDSGSDDVTSTGGRGIYFADWQGKNYFRVTIESDLSGKGRVDKYVGSGYVTSGWSWQ